MWSVNSQWVVHSLFIYLSIYLLSIVLNIQRDKHVANWATTHNIWMMSEKRIQSTDTIRGNILMFSAELSTMNKFPWEQQPKLHKKKSKNIWINSKFPFATYVLVKISHNWKKELACTYVFYERSPFWWNGNVLQIVIDLSFPMYEAHAYTHHGINIHFSSQFDTREN